MDETIKPMCHRPHKVIVIFVIITLVCLSLFFLGAFRNSLKEFDYIGKSAETPNTIAVTGEGSVNAVPDIAKIEVGLNTEAKTVAAAQKENTEKMNAVIAAIKGLGIEAKDLQTQNYNIYPKYEWTDGKSKIVGYTVNQSLKVKVRDNGKVSEVLKVSADNGANQIGNLNFEIDDPDKLTGEAREKAIEDAEQKAETLAKSLGVKLGKVVSFSEANAGRVDYPKYMSAADGFGVGGGTPAPEIQAGENEIKVEATIVYEIL